MRTLAPNFTPTRDTAVTQTIQPREGARAGVGRAWPIWRVLATGAATLLSATGMARADGYEARTIAVPDGMEFYAAKINSHDLTPGYMTPVEFRGTSSAQRAYVWDFEHGLTPVATDLGTSSYCVDVNDAGQVVGSFNVPDLGGGYHAHGFLWTRSGGTRPLGEALVEDRYMVPLGISDGGVVVLSGASQTGPSHSVIIDANDPALAPIDVASLGGLAWADAYGLSRSGWAWGDGMTAAGDARGFLWDPSSPSQLTVMADLVPLFANDVGDCVCRSPNGFYLRDHATGDLVSIPPPTVGVPTGVTYFPDTLWIVGINSHRQVLGQLTSSLHDDFGEYASRAFVWDPGTGTSTDIGTAGGDFTVATGINDAGIVVGTSMPTPAEAYSTGEYLTAYTVPFEWTSVGGLVRLVPEGTAINFVSAYPFGLTQSNLTLTVIWDPLITSERALLWDLESATFTDIGRNQGWTPPNEAGHVSGMYYDSYSQRYIPLFLAPATFTPAGGPGKAVDVTPNAGATLTFDGITAAGDTKVLVYDVDDPTAPDVPAQFALAGTGSLLAISTTATFSGSIELALHYDDTGMSAARENQVRLLHFVDPQWVDATDYSRPGGFLDKVNNIVYGKVTSLSPFAIVEVLDNTAPAIAAHADVNADATSTLGATVTYTAPTATDDVDETVAVTCSPASGTLFPVGITTVACTASDAHHNTAASTFDVIVRIDPHYLKGAVADALNSLIPTSDKPTVKKLLKAIKDIEDSLASDLWADDFHLTEKGRRVFKEESEAVAQLVAIANPASGVSQAVASLVEADRVLAQKAIDDATAANPTSSHLSTAASEMTLASSSNTSGEFRDAIKHYRKAWKAALKAQGLM